jgi:hypothetical protein
MTPVFACFVSTANCAAQIVAAKDAATAEIRVQAYAFTFPPILGALASAMRRGSDVQVVFDWSNNHIASEPRDLDACNPQGDSAPVMVGFWSCPFDCDTDGAV